MGSIIDYTKNKINNTAFANTVIYGGKAIMDLTQMFQKPGYIEKPIIQSPSVRAPVLDVNTRPFDQVRKSLFEESAGARRVAVQTGKPSMVGSIFAQTLKGLNQITSQKSGYLTDVSNKNSVFAADAFNKMEAGNAKANNAATQLQLNMQTQENALTDKANAIAAASFYTSLGQLAMVGSQKSQSLVDLMYIEKMLGGYGGTIKFFDPIKPKVNRDNIKPIFSNNLTPTLFNTLRSKTPKSIDMVDLTTNKK